MSEKKQKLSNNVFDMVKSILGADIIYRFFGFFRDIFVFKKWINDDEFVSNFKITQSLRKQILKANMVPLLLKKRSENNYSNILNVIINTSLFVFFLPLIVFYTINYLFDFSNFLQVKSLFDLAWSLSMILIILNYILSAFVTVEGFDAISSVFNSIQLICIILGSGYVNYFSSFANAKTLASIGYFVGIIAQTIYCIYHIFKNIDEFHIHYKYIDPIFSIKIGYQIFKDSGRSLLSYLSVWFLQSTLKKYNLSTMFHIVESIRFIPNTIANAILPYMQKSIIISKQQSLKKDDVKIYDNKIKEYIYLFFRYVVAVIASYGSMFALISHGIEEQYHRVAMWQLLFVVVLVFNDSLCYMVQAENKNKINMDWFGVLPSCLLNCVIYFFDVQFSNLCSYFNMSIIAGLTMARMLQEIIQTFILWNILDVKTQNNIYLGFKELGVIDNKIMKVEWLETTKIVQTLFQIMILPKIFLNIYPSMFSNFVWLNSLLNNQIFTYILSVGNCLCSLMPLFCIHVDKVKKYFNFIIE